MGLRRSTFQQPLTKPEVQIFAQPRGVRLGHACRAGWWVGWVEGGGGQCIGSLPLGPGIRGRRSPSGRFPLTPGSLSHLYVSLSHTQVCKALSQSPLSVKNRTAS